MTRRYEIQDILAQDARGVIFHAFDNEREVDVVLRRFFPFGPDGGGLAAEEQEAYGVALRNLKSLEYVGLRKILDGGCDPVDGMPFLVTEWVEGQRLSSYLAEASLSAESARAVLGYALEASRVLAGVLGRQEVWVETAPESILLSEGEGGRGVTFWICPFRWLASGGRSEGLVPLAELAEDVMGWRGRAIGDGAGGGLGAWVKAIRHAPHGWSLEEAEAALMAPVAGGGEVVEEPAAAVVPTAAVATGLSIRGEGAKPLVVAMPKASVWPRVLMGVLFLVVAGLGYWFAQGGRVGGSRGKAEVKSKVEVVRGVEKKGAEKSGVGGALAGREESGGDEGDGGVKSGGVVEEEAGDGLSASDEQRARLEAMAKKMAEEAAAKPVVKSGNELEVIGEVVGVEVSKSGAMRYFKLKVGEEFRWAAHPARVNAWTLEEMKGMVGKRVKVSGLLRDEPSYRKTLVIFDTKEQVTELPK